MADNIVLNVGVDGAELATDEITSVHYQKVLLGFGADGTWTRVTAAAGFPVVAQSGATWACAQSGTWNIGTVTTVTTITSVTDLTKLGGQAVSMGTGVRDAGTQRVTIATDDSVPVTGTFWQATQPVSAASLPLPSGAATSANQTTGNASLSSIDGKVTACNTGAVVVSSGAITETNSGSIKTAVELIDGAVYVDDADWTDSNSSHLLVGGLYQSSPQSITDGDVGPFQVDSNGRQLVKALNYDVLTTGTLTAQGQAVTTAAANLGTAGLGISGTWVGTIVVQGDVGDGVWATIPLIHSLTGAAVASATANGNWFVGLAGFLNVRVYASEWTSGTATIYLEGTAAPAGVFLNRSIPTGGNLIGSVLLAAGDANVGNVDLVSLPAGNLGQQAMAASLSVVPASDITDETYIGDIKFGEALPAGTNAIGKLAANTGVDIGDVDVTSISAGTNTIGGVIGQQSSSVVYDGTTACTVKEFMVIGTTAGNNTLVDAVAAKKIRLLSLFVIATSATANTFYLVNGDYDFLGSSAATIPVAVDADADNVPGFSLPQMRRTTDTVNEALVAVQSATAALIYLGTYIEVA